MTATAGTAPTVRSFDSLFLGGHWTAPATDAEAPRVSRTPAPSPEVAAPPAG